MVRAELAADHLVAGEVADLVVRLHNDGPGECSNVVFRVRLPPQIVLLRGRDRFEVPRLAAGRSAEQTLRVRPKEAGSYTITSGDFSYRDRNGLACRVSNFSMRLTVAQPRPAAPMAEPRLAVELLSTRMPCGDWGTLRGRVVNIGEPAVHDVTLRIDGPMTIDQRTALCQLGSLAPGFAVEFEAFVRFGHPGSRVPVHIDVRFADPGGRRHDLKQTVPIQVDRGAQETNAHGSGDRLKILYLSANPSDEIRLRVDAEIREIRETLQLGKSRDRFELHQRSAVRAKDISQALLDVTPRIVHFSGHGWSNGLVVEDEVGRSSRATIDGLADLFSLMTGTVECVIVNACHSYDVAQAVGRHVDYVIGMRDEVGDKAAIIFSIGFYQALAGDRSIEDAFGFGRTQLRMQLHAAEHERPVLLKR